MANGWGTRRPQGTSTAAIYRTAEHRKARAALVAAHYDGAPCCLCGHPMHGPTRNLHADHLPGTTQYRGLAHAACNRRDGAKRGRAKQNPPAPLPRWR